MARQSTATKTKSPRRKTVTELTLWEQEYVERKPRFEPAPLPDHIPADSVLRQDYSLDYLMKHPDVAEAILRDHEKYIGPLPPVRIGYTKRSYGKKRNTQSGPTKTRRPGISD